MRQFKIAIAMAFILSAGCSDGSKDGTGDSAAVNLSERAGWIEVSKETTFITGPLDEHGFPDYVGALNVKYGTGVTPENNAAVPLVSILDYRLSDEAKELMGIPPMGGDAGPRFMGLSSDYRRYFEWRKSQGLPSLGPAAGGSEGELDQSLREQISQAMLRPWTREEFGVVATWLSDMDGALNAITQASQRERYWVPITGKDWRVTTEKVAVFRSVNQALMARAMNRLSKNDAAGAARDLHTAFRLANLLSQAPVVITQLISSTLRSVAIASAPRILLDPGIPSKQRRELVRELSGVRAHKRMLEGFKNELRIGFPWLVIDSIMSGRVQLAGEGWKIAAPQEVRWNEILRQLQSLTDTELACIEEESMDRQSKCRENLKSDAAQANLEWQAIRDEMKEGEGIITPEKYAQYVVSRRRSFGGDVGTLYFARARAYDANSRLLLLSHAVGVYGMQHRGYPNTLEGFSSEYFDPEWPNPQAHGYRYRYYPAGQNASGGPAGSFALTAVAADALHPSATCFDSSGRWVVARDGQEPKVEKGSCLDP